MGSPQQAFLSRFRAALAVRFPDATDWGGGQVIVNGAALKPQVSLRRGGTLRAGERFELGDLRCSVGRVAIVIEYESCGVAVHNLLKYWPYLRGELSACPSSPVVLCHFSDWSSYGSYRDLWEWLASRIAADPTRQVRFVARQFDHWGSDLEAGERSIVAALDWLEGILTTGLR